MFNIICKWNENPFRLELLSILYFNAVIWLTPELNAAMKHALLSTSANVLRSCKMINCSEISFESIHSIRKKSTPKQIMLFQISLKLHKLLNEINQNCTFEHLTILDQIICTRRQNTFEIFRAFNTEIGMNAMANKLCHINKQIGLVALNVSFVHFKNLMKIQFS